MRRLLPALCPLLCAAGACQNDADSLPAPTGAHAVGRFSVHWRDAAREERETVAAGDVRELVVHVFHPADAAAAAAAPRATYVPDADVMRGPWNDETLARIAALRPHARENVPLPAGDARFPVLVLLPGGGMKALAYHALCEDLASHGWVAAAIDPPFNAHGVRLPDGRVLGNLPQAERTWPRTRVPADEQRHYRERIEHWAHDVKFVIDQLHALDRDDARCRGRLDLARGVGVLGHSRGGQAAAAVRVLDERVRAGVNVDGTAGELVVQSIDGKSRCGTTPFLWLQKALPRPPSDEQLRRTGRTREQFDAEVARVRGEWRRQLGSIGGGALLVWLERPGIAHIDFSDEPWWDGTMTDALRPGRERTLAETRAWLRAFFDTTVRDEPDALRAMLGAPPDQVAVERFGPFAK